jgi:CBS domain-containing protein
MWAVTGNYLKSTRIAGGVGIGFSWLLFMAGLLSFFGGNMLGGVWLFFLGTFLQNAAQSSIAYAQLQQLLDGVRVTDMMRRQPVTVDAHLTLREVADQFFLRYPYKAYPVVRDGEFVGMLTLGALQETERGRWEVVRAGDLAAGRGRVPVVHPREPVLQALRKLAESGQSRLPVVEEGSLVGLLCARDLMDLMEIRAGLVPPHGGPGGLNEPLPGRAVPAAVSGSQARAPVGR